MMIVLCCSIIFVFDLHYRGTNSRSLSLADLVYLDLYIYIVLIVVSNVEKREDPKGTSNSSLKYSEDPTEKHAPAVIPSPRRNVSRAPPLESTIRENYRRNDGVGRSNTDDMTPLIVDPPRRVRPGDVTASADLPQYERSNGRDYPVVTRKRTGPGGSDDAGFYVGRSPEHEQSLPYVEYFTALCHPNRWLLDSHAYSLTPHP